MLMHPEPLAMLSFMSVLVLLFSEATKERMLGVIGSVLLLITGYAILIDGIEIQTGMTSAISESVLKNETQVVDGNTTTISGTDTVSRTETNTNAYADMALPFSDVKTVIGSTTIFIALYLFFRNALRAMSGK